jgi:hypothetical protein
MVLFEGSLISMDVHSDVGLYTPSVVTQTQLTDRLLTSRATGSVATTSCWNSKQVVRSSSRFLQRPEPSPYDCNKDKLEGEMKGKTNSDPEQVTDSVLSGM